MPAYFELSQGVEIVSPTKADQAMCRHFNVDCDPNLWYMDWYNTVGLALACGATKEYLLSINIKQELKDIVEWLFSNYTIRSGRL